MQDDETTITMLLHLVSVPAEKKSIASIQLGNCGVPPKSKRALCCTRPSMTLAISGVDVALTPVWVPIIFTCFPSF